MVGKKQNDFLGWRNKLDALDSLPGEAFVEKKEAWEKLQARMQKKPRSSKAIWYWAAAAAILLVMMLPVLMNSNKENETQGISAATEQPKKLSTPVLPVVSSDSLAIVQNTNTERKPVILSNIRTRQPALVNIVPKENSQSIAVIETPVEVKNPETLTTIILPDTLAALAAAVPVTKKMKIVHINDLETFPLPFYSSAKQAQKAFRIKIGNNAANQSSLATQEYSSALEIKIPFKN